MDVVTIIAILGLIFTSRGWYNQLRQTKLAEQQARREAAQHEDFQSWAEKCNTAVAALKKIYPGYICEGSSGLTSSTGLVLPEPELRGRIEM